MAAAPILAAGRGARYEIDHRRAAPSGFRSTRGVRSRSIIEAPSLDAVRGLDATANVGYAVEAGRRERERA